MPGQNFPVREDTAQPAMRNPVWCHHSPVARHEVVACRGSIDGSASHHNKPSAEGLPYREKTQLKMLKQKQSVSRK